jgi:hypothetical protein
LASAASPELRSQMRQNLEQYTTGQLDPAKIHPDPDKRQQIIDSWKQIAESEPDESAASAISEQEQQKQASAALDSGSTDAGAKTHPAWIEKLLDVGDDGKATGWSADQMRSKLKKMHKEMQQAVAEKGHAFLTQKEKRERNELVEKNTRKIAKLKGVMQEFGVSEVTDHAEKKPGPHLTKSTMAGYNKNLKNAATGSLIGTGIGAGLGALAGTPAGLTGPGLFTGGVVGHTVGGLVGLAAPAIAKGAKKVGKLVGFSECKCHGKCQKCQTKMAETMPGKPRKPRKPWRITPKQYGSRTLATCRSRS